MKQILRAAFYFLLLAGILFTSCHKNKINTNVNGVQQQPPPPPPQPPPPPPTGSYAGQEFIFNSAWAFWTDAMGDMIYISISPSNSFPIAAMATQNTEVLLQLDSTTVWIVLPQWDWYGTNSPWPATNGHAWYFPHYPYYDNTNFLIENYPHNYALIGKPVKVKVKFL